jgi:hypothetical protein
MDDVSCSHQPNPELHFATSHGVLNCSPPCFTLVFMEVFAAMTLILHDGFCRFKVAQFEHVFPLL